MSYVWEYISEEDKRRIGFDELTRPWWRGTPSSWTIDRETGHFLLDVTQRNEDTRNQLNYLFYWRGHVISVETTWNQTMHDSGGSTYCLNALRKPELPVGLESEWPKMLRELGAAMTCDKSRGGRRTVTVVLQGF